MLDRLSEGYKGAYLDDPDKHYAEVTALRPRSWAWIAENKYNNTVTGQALSAWYRGHTNKLENKQEQSAMEKLAGLETSPGRISEPEAEEVKLPYKENGRWYFNDKPLAYTAYGKLEDREKRVISRKQFDRMKIKPLAKRIDRWIKAYFPLYSWTPTPNYILEIIIVWIKTMRSGLPTLVLEPRDHGKTTVYLGLFLFWLVDQKRTLFILTSHAKKTDLFRAIHDSMIREKVRVDYGDLIASKDQTSRHIYFIDKYQQFHHDPFLMIATLDGGYIGKHSEWMHMEDPIQEPAVSQATNERRVDNYSSGIEDISKLKSASGTRKDPKDYYHHIIDFGYRVLHRKAVEFIEGTFPRAQDFYWETYLYNRQLRRRAIGLRPEYLRTVKYRTLNCPEYSFERLMIRYIRNPHSFYSQMQNEPRPKKGIKFDPDDIKQIEPYSRGELKNTLVLVGDPSFGTTGSDYAIVVVAWFGGRFITLDIEVGDKGYFQFVADFIRMTRFWKPKTAYVEDDFHRVTNRQNEFQELQQIPQLDTFRQKGYGDKLDRIEMMVPPVMRQECWVYKTATDLEILMDQIRTFNGAKGKWDALDVWQSAYRLSSQEEDNDFFYTEF